MQLNQQDALNQMVLLPNGQLAVVLDTHSQGDCRYLTGDGRKTWLANFQDFQPAAELSEPFGEDRQ